MLPGNPNLKLYLFSMFLWLVWTTENPAWQVISHEEHTWILGTPRSFVAIYQHQHIETEDLEHTCSHLEARLWEKRLLKEYWQLFLDSAALKMLLWRENWRPEWGREIMLISSSYKLKMRSLKKNIREPNTGIYDEQDIPTCSNSVCKWSSNVKHKMGKM